MKIRISDPKSEYGDIAVRFPLFHLLSWDDLRFNPLIPPPNVPTEKWYQVLVDHMSQVFNFWEGAKSLMIRLLDEVRSRYENPTFIDLYRALDEVRARFKQKDYMIMSTVSSRLELMLYGLKDVILEKSSMLPELMKHNFILQTAGMMSELESWLLEFLLLWEYMYRLFNPRERELSVHIYDECQHRLFSQEKELKVKKISSSMISMLVDEARELNIAIIALSQEPSTLLKSVLNNSWLKVCFHLSSGSETRIMGDAMGLDNDQAQELYHLETGEAVVRMAGGFTDAFPVRIREYEPLGAVDDGELREHQARMKEELYEEAGIVDDGVGDQFHDDSGVGGNGSDDGQWEEPYDVLD